MKDGVRKRLLITGATGLVGRTVTERLLASDRYSIKVQVRNPLGARAAVGHLIDFTKVGMDEADFTRVGDREMRLLTKGANIVVHAAGLTQDASPQYQEFEVINVRATQLLAEAAANNGVHTLLFLSSAAVYGQGPYTNADEQTPLKAVTPYAVSKMACEQHLMRFSGIPRIIILRPAMILGEGDHDNLIEVTRSIKEGKYKPSPDATSAGKSYIYSRDLAEAVDLALSHVPEGIHVFNVANPAPVSVKELTESIAGTLGTQLPQKQEGLFSKMGNLFKHDKTPTNEQVSRLSTATTVAVQKFVSLTGFAPRYSLAQALKAEMDWAKQSQLI